MNKEKKNNRPLILSIITLMICIALLIGATMAWFTDTETNTGNTIQAGTLDAELWIKISDEQPEALDETWTQITNDSQLDSIFGKFFKNWQPGDEETIYFAVKNAGSLTLDYTLDLVVGNDDLADALQFSTSGINNVVKPVSGYYITVSSQTNDKVISTTGTDPEELEPTAIDYTTISMKLDESTGNTYQDLEFEMDLILVATQEDLIQNTEDAYENPIVYAYDVDDIKSAETDSTVILMKDITSTDAVALTTNVNFDLNGYTLTVPSFSMANEQDYCTVDIADGTIYTTAGDITINIPNGTLNYSESTLQVATSYIVDVTVSEHTVTYSGTCNFYEVAEGGGMTTASVVVNEGVEVIINEDAVVTANIETTEGETYVFINNGKLIGEASGATNEDGAILVSGDADALLDAMKAYPDVTAFVLDAGTYNAPTEITSSVTIIGAGSTRLNSASVTTLAFSKGLEVSDDNVELTFASLDFDADITTGKFNNGYGIIELKNASNITLNIEDCYVVEKAIVNATNFISASIYLENLENPTINVDNSYLLGRYTIMVASYTGSEGRGNSHNVTDAVYNITDSTLKGWTTGNMRGEDTVYTATNCTLIGENPYSGTNNSYSTFVMTDGSIDSTYTLNNCIITATNTGDMEQNCFSFQYGAKNNTLYLNDCIYEMYPANGVSAAVVSVSLGGSGYPDTTGSTVVLDGTTYENLAIDKYLITDGKLIEQE